MFTFLLTFNILMIVVAGGLGSLTGSILGSVIITVLLEWLRVVESPHHLGGFAIPGIPGMRMVVFSAGPPVHHPVPTRGHHGNA